jgi:hypothetical protein
MIRLITHPPTTGAQTCPGQPAPVLRLHFTVSARRPQTEAFSDKITNLCAEHFQLSSQWAKQTQFQWARPVGWFRYCGISLITVTNNFSAGA